MQGPSLPDWAAAAMSEAGDFQLSHQDLFRTVTMAAVARMFGTSFNFAPAEQQHRIVESIFALVGYTLTLRASSVYGLSPEDAHAQIQRYAALVRDFEEIKAMAIVVKAEEE